MLQLLDKDIILAEPPQLPPILRDSDKRPERDYVIAPDIMCCEIVTKTQHDNCYTLHYVWMSRIWGAFEKIEIAHVNSRTYRQWLDTYDMPNGIPPHIQFGGAVVAGARDPTFHARWVAYVRKTFC